MTILRAATVALLAIALSGCISLFPKTKPAQMYTFGIEPQASDQPWSPTFNVQRVPISFAYAAQSDRILTIDGTQAAYIAEARWVAPASSLFDEAETRAFENARGPARILRAGDSAAAPVTLRVDVQSFEARYENGPKAAPTIVVAVRAVLISTTDRRVLGDRVFVSRQPAADNRVGAIVDGFDAAVGDVLGHIADWTGRRGEG